MMRRDDLEEVEVCFAVPVKHPGNAGSYGKVLELLGATLRSISRQTHDSFRIVVALTGNRRPEFSHPAVSYVANDFPERSHGSTAQASNFRVNQDKGCRVASALAHAARRFRPRYVMVVDADDFVNRKLVDFVARQGGCAGWYFPRGLRFSGHTRKIDLVDEFWTHCGTSHVLHSDFLPVPDDVDPHASKDEWMDALEEHYVTNILGSHLDFQEYVASSGGSLDPLPFVGSVWHQDTGENTSHLFAYRWRGPIWGKDVRKADRIRERFGLPNRRRTVVEEAALRLRQGKSITGRAVRALIGRRGLES